MRVCEVCGKRSVIQKSGAHQYGGGWAMRATKKRKVWQVNLHNVKVNYKGVRRTMRLCTKCLRKVKSSASAKAVQLPVIALVGFYPTNKLIGRRPLFRRAVKPFAQSSTLGNSKF